MKAFVVFDSKAEAYGLPFFMKSTGEAVRGFQTAAKDPQSQISKYPSDFTLFEIGEYDETTAQISQYQASKPLGCAIEYIQQG